MQFLSLFKKIAHTYKVSDLCLLLYLCALFAHRSGNGFDYVFLRGSFIAYVSVSLIFDILPQMRNKATDPKLFNLSTVWFCCFWGLAFLSTFWSSSVSNTLDSLYITNAVQSFFLVVLIVYRIKNLNDVRAVILLVVIATLYSCLLLFLKTPISSWGSERVGEALGLNSNTVGIGVSFASLLTMYLYKSKPSVVYIAIIVVFAVVAMFSGSRKALVVIVLALVFFYSFSERGMRGVLNTAIALVAIAVIYSVIMSNEDFYFVIGKRIERGLTFLVGGSGIVDQSDVERAFYRNYAFQMFSERPILGFGFNGFLTEMQAINYDHQAYSHCNQLEILADMGVIGFIVYYGFFANLLRGFIKAISQLRIEAILGISFILIIFISDYFYVSFVTPNIYLYAAILFGLMNSIDKDGLRGQAS